MALTVVLNGQPRSFEALSGSARVEELVQELGLKGDRVAVELNGEIVPRAGWADAELHAGDRVEVVHFVGGGTFAAGTSETSCSSSASQRLP
ncbi:sulfur carrier protein ThiS [Edaphobacter acidisoli]|uniref:sulfur carrier protein ThiS n=1 Tax=Edaphobacter acidisoli TaxID=2040573 RepID=UPI00166AF291|nr:sulfur carrier protein ThiS [Edaphobacter acidisoli]